jgi:4-aminobutyrate--pyruvate transaminase
MAGLCTSLSYSSAKLVEAAREQMTKLPFTHLFSGRSHAPAIALAGTFMKIAAMPVSKVYDGSCGSDANDSQLNDTLVKLVWSMNHALGRPHRKTIIARLKGYHGVTVASASLTGLPDNHIASSCRPRAPCTPHARTIPLRRSRGERTGRFRLPRG